MSPLVAVLGVALTALLGACQDPCVALAERICNCEQTAVERLTCRRNRVLNQQARIEISDEDRTVCTAALDTCTCAAIDRNDLGSCGFTRERSGVDAE